MGSILFAVSVEHGGRRWYFDSHFTFYLVALQWLVLGCWALRHYRHPYAIAAEDAAHACGMR